VGKIKFIYVLFVACFLFVFAYIMLRVIGGLEQGYLWEDMDWNKDGTTTICELIDASDIGRREVVNNGNNCIEYYAYKDGLQINMICPK
jgi:hypothetical protein